MLFDKKVIYFDQDASSNTEALAKLANRLHAAGVVNDQYKDAILKREANFPTGLMTKTIGVAIPHCDADKVIQPQIGFMRLKKPVTFHQMGDNSEIQVRVIFMLALKKSDDQLTMLQKLMALFQNEDAMAQVQQVTSVNDFITVMKNNEIIK